MSLLELPIILLYVHMISSFSTHDLVTDSQGGAICSFLYLKYIKVMSLETLLFFLANSRDPTLICEVYETFLLLSQGLQINFPYI